MIAVACAEWSAEMVGGHFLEFGEMFARGGGIAAALKSAGETKLGGGMKRKEGDSFLEGGDGLVVALKLGIQVADEIPRVSFVGDLRNVSEGSDAFFRITEIFVSEAEVVPSVGILGQFFGGGGKSGARGLELLLREERDAEVEACDFEFGIGGKRLFEEFLCVGGALLIHVSDAEGVEAIGFGRVGVGRGFLGGGRRLGFSRARMKKGGGDG